MTYHIDNNGEPLCGMPIVNPKLTTFKDSVGSGKHLCTRCCHVYDNWGLPTPNEDGYKRGGRMVDSMVDSWRRSVNFIVIVEGTLGYRLMSWYDVEKELLITLTDDECTDITINDIPMTRYAKRRVTIYKWTTLREYELTQDNEEKTMPVFEKKPVAAAVFSGNHYYPNPNTPKKSKEDTMNRIAKFVTITIAVSISIIVLMVILRVVFQALSIIPPVQGIITLPGETESVLLCFDDCGKPGDVTPLGKDVGTSYCTDYGLVVENAGHKADFNAYERAAHDLCGFKAAERPWYQRAIGIAGHNHFTKKGTSVVYAIQHPDLNQGEVGISGAPPAGGFTTNPETIGRHLETCDSDFNLIWTK